MECLFLNGSLDLWTQSADEGRFYGFHPRLPFYFSSILTDFSASPCWTALATVAHMRRPILFTHIYRASLSGVSPEALSQSIP